MVAARTGRLCGGAVLILAASCGRPQPSGSPPSAPSEHAAPASRAAAARAPSADLAGSAGAAPSAPAAGSALASEPRPCGALGCLAFGTPEAAFARVLARAPRVLAVGEAHAQRDAPPVPSSTARFTERFLPLLSGKASDLVIELWLANGSCGKSEREVQARQAPVTAPQAETNQAEFVALGTRAKALGIAPHALTPSCDQYRAILRAGSDDIGRMLTAVASETERTVERLLALRADAGSGLIVAYGGAMHNDLEVASGHESWSFGPALARVTGGRYIELDLIVPEFIKDNESWRSLPWYSAYDAAADPGRTLLYNPRPDAYVLIFPRLAR